MTGDELMTKAIEKDKEEDSLKRRDRKSFLLSCLIKKW
jgi:hypothetical protein